MQSLSDLQAASAQHPLMHDSFGQSAFEVQRA
jgi:hypothetical protein